MRVTCNYGARGLFVYQEASPRQAAEVEVNTPGWQGLKLIALGVDDLTWAEGFCLTWRGVEPQPQ